MSDEEATDVPDNEAYDEVDTSKTKTEVDQRLSLLDSVAQDAEALASDDDYEVGYGKPPKHSRFQKGVSGNPRGRKRKSRNASTLLAEELEQKITVKDAGGERRITKREAVIKSLVNDAITGKNHARPLLLKILELENSGEPFVATESDVAALAELLARKTSLVGEDG